MSIRHARTAILLLLVLATGTTTSVLGAEPPRSAQEPSAASAAEAFEQLKGLAGTWRADSTKGWEGEVVIEVIARGSVVMSTTTFRDAPESKMVTMYSLDGDRLVAVHYCEAGNQPRLQATTIESDRLDLTFASGGNLASRDDGHMDRAVLRFGDDGRFSSRWTWYQDGNERWLEEIEYRRVH